MKYGNLSPADLLKLVKDEEIQFIKLWFTDILGFLKSIEIHAGHLEKVLEEGQNFDGSSIKGFARIDESDMLAVPDLSTFMILPWTKDYKVGALFCDVHTPDGQPYAGCPRQTLKRMLKRAADLGYRYLVGPELEYFYFKNNRSPEPLDRGGYFDLMPRDEAIALRRMTVDSLSMLGIDVEVSHHEVAPSQHEIDLKYNEALRMADQTMAYRLTVKEVAQLNDVYATFMPKPIFGENGSGMHVHQSLFRGTTNAFHDPRGAHGLSETALQFMAGLLDHAREITLVTNQWVNSYKRLVPGYEAPIYISWATQNRSHLVRIPAASAGNPRSVRLEYRCPDPAANPYLAFAVMLAAGLKGIEEKRLPRPALELNLFELGEERRREMGIDSLPGGLYEAIEVARGSELLRDALGEHIFGNLIINKEMEWERYRAHVTAYEIDRYLPLL